MVSFFTEVSFIYWGVPHIEGCPPFKDVLKKCPFYCGVLLYWSVPHLLRCPPHWRVSPIQGCVKNVLLHWGVLIYWSVRHLLKCPQHWHGVLHPRAFSTTLGNSIIPQPYRGQVMPSSPGSHHNTTPQPEWFGTDLIQQRSCGFLVSVSLGSGFDSLDSVWFVFQIIVMKEDQPIWEFTDYGHPVRSFFHHIPNYVLANWVDWQNKL